MKRLSPMLLLALAACATDPAQRGAGFGPYDPYAADREAALRGQDYGPVISGPQTTGPITSAELAAAGIGLDGGSAPATTDFPAAAPGGNVGISDEQDFGAVSSRETIESDAARVAAQREAYRVIEPEPLPQRPSDTGPNIVAFALSTTNQPGERIYSRSALHTEARFQRNCARYTTADQAQRAFLESGGPRRDRMGLDPDGDGFACYWDPRPFRAARQG